ncbi:MAG: hypothetical protein MI919_42585 [Holophagales bacterium]|nr:hypothetical protein [Holophagales bacterium]
MVVPSWLRPALQLGTAVSCLVLPWIGSIALAGPAMGDPIPAVDPEDDLGGVEIEQTLDRIETIGNAVLAWWTDQVFPTPLGAEDRIPTRARAPEMGVPIFDVHDVPAISAGELEALLVPTYLAALPGTDGWGKAFELRLDTSIQPGPLPFVIRSAGSDGLYSGTVYTPGFTSDATGDLVWYSDVFLRRPPPTAAEAPIYTEAVLRRILAAVGSWRTDQVGGAIATSGAPGLTGCDGYQVDVSAVPAITADALEALLAPGYLTFLPRVDGWQHALDFRFDTDLFAVDNLLAVRSPGSDGGLEGSVYMAGFTSSDAEDLVAHDLYLVRRPPATGREQEETLGEIMVMGAWILSWVTDNIRAPAGTMPFDVGDLAAITHGDLENLLVPLYLPCLPRRDFWGNEYDFWLDPMNLFSSPLTGIRSRGSDGIAEGPVYLPGPFPAAATENDLLWVDGILLRFPDSTLLFLNGFEDGGLGAWSSSEPRAFP